MKKFKVGLQLFSVRNEMEKDMEDTLKRVKDMGYDNVEFAGYFGKTAEEVKELLDKYGLDCASVHQGIDPFREQGQPAYDYIKTIGVSYDAIPGYNIKYYLDDLDGTIERFTEVGKRMKENGIQLLYHNHDFEFRKIDGEYIMDKLYRTIPEQYLQPEFDTCWIHYAGINPSEYIKQYDGRCKVLHLKDFICKNISDGPIYDIIKEADERSSVETRPERGFEFRPVGYGVQNFEEIIKSAEDIGVEYLIVEQDASPSGNPLSDAKKSREYLKSIGI